MSKSVVAAIAVVLAAVVALYFLLDRERAPVTPPPPDEPAAAVDRRAEPPPPAIVAAPESRGVAAIRPARFVDPEAVNEVLRVLVLDDATGIPVPGAEVAWTDESRLPPSRAFFYASPSTLVSDFDRAAQRTVADARGVAVVRTSDRLAVAARSGGRFGFRSFRQPPRGEIRLGIVDGPFIAARVVDVAGAPVAGVLVMISMVTRKANSASNRGFYATSRDSDGLAIVHHPGVSLEGPFDGRFADGELKEVTASIEGAPQDGKVKATLEELKAGPIKLVLLPTGRVVVKVTDSEGKPFLSDARISLTARASGKTTWPAQFEATAIRGAAAFSLVPVGVPLAASAESADFDTVTRENLESLEGPGREATIELRFARRRALVRGRAVDENGSPLRGKNLEAELVHGDRVLILSGVMRIATDARGEFRLPIDRGNPRLSDVDLMLQMRDERDAIELEGGTPLPTLSANPETDVGDIRLVGQGSLVSGVVRDELGTPLAGALVTSADLQGHYPPGYVMSIGSRNRPDGPEFYRARTDEAGTFVIPRQSRTALRIGSFSLKADLPGYVCPEQRMLTPDEKGVTIVLHGTGTIEGRILLPDLAPVRKLTVQVTVSDCTPGCKPNYVFDDSVDSTGSFRLTGIQPGTAKVDVLMAGMATPLASVASVLVRRLATADDARLREIDLRGHAALRP